MPRVLHEVPCEALEQHKCVSNVTDLQGMRLRRWLDGSSLIFAENVQGVRFDPPNHIVNKKGCTHGNYRRPISLGVNALDVTFGDGRDYMA